MCDIFKLAVLLLVVQMRFSDTASSPTASSSAAGTGASTTTATTTSTIAATTTTKTSTSAANTTTTSSSATTTATTTAGAQASLCNTGCLACSTDSKCLYCDLSQGYYLQKDSCAALPKLDNCTYRSIFGDCLLCDQTYYIDSGKCVAVPTASVIAHCAIYAVSNMKFSCTACASGFVVSSGTCQAVKIQIADCTAYNAEGSACLACGSKVPSTSFDSCDAAPIAANCSSFSKVKCTLCNSGYIIDANYYIAAMLAFDPKSNDFYYPKYLYDLKSTGVVLNLPVCRPVKVDNCASPSSYNTCTKCANYYYLSDGQCYPYPYAMIQNCKEYSTVSSCKTCAQGNYLASSSSCLPVTAIDNCQTYNTGANGVCDVCLAGFYSVGASCKSRSAVDVNCKDYVPNNDLCAACVDGFVLNVSTTVCLKGVPSCGAYSVTESSATCTGCIDNYYLNGQVCSIGSIDNCTVYSSATQCLTCGQGYYRGPDGLCAKHTLSSRIMCSAFSTTFENYCTVCQSSRIGFQLDNLCVAVTTPVPSCVSYSADNTCYSCDASQYYLTDNTCTKGLISKCSRYSRDSNRCTSCVVDAVSNIGYVVSADADNNKCVSNNPNLYTNCALIADTPAKPCLYCSEQYYPMSIASTRVAYCVPKTYYAIDGIVNAQNCLVFNSATGNCSVCANNAQGVTMVVSATGACSSACDASEAIMTFKFASFNLESTFVCTQLTAIASASFTPQFGINCLRFDDNRQNTDKVCAQCPANAIGVFNFTYVAHNSSRFAYLLTTSVTSSASFYNRIAVNSSCVSSTVSTTGTNASGTLVSRGANLVSGATPSLQNCRFVASTPNRSGEYYCASCRLGYSGKVYADANQQAYLISSCAIMTECAADTWYGGLGGLTGQVSSSRPYPIDFYVSCHLCKSSGAAATIPTYALPLSSVSSVSPNITAFLLSRWGYNPAANTQAPYLLADSFGVNQTACLTPGLSQATSFISNCAVQEVDPTKVLGPYSSGAAASSTNPICVACAPGYKPAAMSAVILGAIDGCVKIANCASSTEFNRCSQCALGYAFETGTSFQSCVATTVDHCFMSIANGSKCLKCMPGYVLSADGSCDAVGLQSCTTSGFIQEPVSFEETYTLYTGGMGCQACSNGIGMLFGQLSTICVNNALLAAAASLPSNTTSVYKVPNCKHYGLLSDAVVCLKCSPSFLLQIDNRACIDSGAVPNCLKAEIGGKTCNQCADGYYFDKSKSLCVTGSLYQCKTYASSSSCAACNDGFMPSAISNNRVACFDIASTKCASADVDKFTRGIMACTTCANNFYPSTSSVYGIFPLQDCIAIPPVNNCSKYETGASLALSSLKCLACASDFYVSAASNTCEQRYNKNGSCSVADPNADACLVCAAGTYLTTDKKSCQPNPTGTVGCIQYVKNNVCTKCDTNMYLSAGACLLVSEDKRVQNCNYYTNQTECSACVRNYYLSGNSCILSIAASCLTHKSQTECSTCADGYGLSKVNDVISCVYVSITNCEVPDYTSLGPNFLCVKCARNFYLSNKSCLAVKLQANNCLYYDSSQNCVQCQSSFILDPTSYKCVSNVNAKLFVDGNCSSNVLATGCNSCSAGYYFFNNTCTACSNAACAFCDSSNPAQCTMCSSGYIHAKDQSCTKIGSSDTGVVKSFSLLGSCAAVYLFLALIRN